MADEGYYDSDEGFCGPSDDDDDVDYSDGENDQRSASSVNEGEPLAAFRKDWFDDLSTTTVPAVRWKRSPLPDTPSTRVLSIPHLLDQILSDFSPSHLSLAALVNPDLCDAAQAILFRRLTIRTVTQTQKLLALFDANPFLLHLSRELELAFGDPQALAYEVEAVKLAIAALEEAEDAQEEAGDVVWVNDDGMSKAVPRWVHELQRGRPVGSAVQLKASRRRNHLRVVLGEKGSSLPDDVSAAINRQWPFDPSSSPPPELEALIRALAPSIAKLSVAFPISHRLSYLHPLLPLFTNLQSFSVTAATQSISVGPVIYAVAVPPIYLQLRAEGRGVVGLGGKVEKVELRGLTLWLDEDKGDTASLNTVDDPSIDGATWQLHQLDLEKVAICELRASTVEAADAAAIRLTYRGEEGDEDDFGAIQAIRDPRASDIVSPPRASDTHSLNLVTFCLPPALDASPPSLSLTSLRLLDVSGVALPSLILAVRTSAPSLAHLALVDLNHLASSSGSPRVVGDDDWLIERTHWTFKTYDRKDRETLVLRQRCFAKLEKAARRLPVKKHYYPLSEAREAFEERQRRELLPLVEILARCTALRTLRLEVDFSVRTSPFPPSILGSIFTARPPLRTLHWTVGVEGPTEKDGLFLVDDWMKFASELQRLGTWESFVSMKSEVRVDVKW